MNPIKLQDKVIDNLKEKLASKKQMYLAYQYMFVIKTIAGTITLNSDYPLASYFDASNLYSQVVQVQSLNAGK